jgi:tryptophan synthase alpha chain
MGQTRYNGAEPTAPARGGAGDDFFSGVTTLSRIAERFETLRARGERAVVCFVTAGDPYPDATADVVVALAEAGADVIEVGIPFSDPLMDGPTIQASTHRALLGGMTPPKVLEAVRQARERSDVPIVLMGAYNPVLRYGVERFAGDARAAGADGAILTDLIPEEAGEWKRVADAAGLDTIFLLSPASTPARLALVSRMSTGFLYCMSRTGVTGARADVPADLPPFLASVRGFSGSLPLCVGFGVSQPEHVAAIGRHADGAVVGAALVSLLHETATSGATPTETLARAGTFVAALKAGSRERSQ